MYFLVFFDGKVDAGSFNVLGAYFERFSLSSLILFRFFEVSYLSCSALTVCGTVVDALASFQRVS